MDRLISITKPDQIPPAYRDTPIGSLLKYHNLQSPLDSYQQAQILIGMCMDNRKNLRIPDNFAYIIRAGGANLRYSEFKVSYAVAIGGVRCISLIGHNKCGMVNLSRSETHSSRFNRECGMGQGMGGAALYAFCPDVRDRQRGRFCIERSEATAASYPKVLIAPMLYRLEDNLLYLIKEG